MNEKNIKVQKNTSKMIFSDADNTVFNSQYSCQNKNEKDATDEQDWSKTSTADTRFMRCLLLDTGIRFDNSQVEYEIEKDEKENPKKLKKNEKKQLSMEDFKPDENVSTDKVEKLLFFFKKVFNEGEINFKKKDTKITLPENFKEKFKEKFKKNLNNLIEKIDNFIEVQKKQTPKKNLKK